MIFDIINLVYIFTAVRFSNKWIPISEPYHRYGLQHMVPVCVYLGNLFQRLVNQRYRNSRMGGCNL